MSRQGPPQHTAQPERRTQAVRIHPERRAPSILSYTLRSPSAYVDCLSPDKPQMSHEMIQRIFHQIWINDEEPALPSKWGAMRDSWLQNNPGWDYKLWNLTNLDFEPSHQHLIDSAPNYAQVSDLLRYQILLRHGGVYIDTDFECFRGIDGILSGVDNFACSEDGRYIGNAILGATAG